MKTQIFFGLITAIVTPFKNNKLDLQSLEKILEYQIANEVSGVVICGSTGEGNNLNINEYSAILESAVKYTKNGIKLIAGCCSTSTAQAVELAYIAKQSGVDGLMCTVPPYVKPTSEGIYQHIRSIHDSVNIPIMIYNTLSRTGVGLDDETLIRIANDLPYVTALKDTGNDIERPLRLKSQIKNGFNFLTGEDNLALAYNVYGGAGCVSVAANIAPKLCKMLQNACNKNDFAAALEINEKLFPLYEALFVESNPIPVKCAASILGLCEPSLRLPLIEASDNTKEWLKQILESSDFDIGAIA